MVADLDKRTWLIGDAGSHQGLDGSDLYVVDGDWLTVIAKDLHDSRNLEYGEAILSIKPAEQIPRKQGHFHVFDAVRPSLAVRVYGKKPLVVESAEIFGYNSLVARPNLQSIPRQRRWLSLVCRQSQTP